MKYLIYFSVIAGTIALSVPSQATDVNEVNRIIKSLAPISGQTVSPGYKDNAGTTPPATNNGGAVNSGQAPATRQGSVTIRNQRVYFDRAYSTDIEVYFSFDSTVLKRRARTQLHELGRALESDQLRPYSYLIAGHTDAKGRMSYNQRLSERRATAVRRFLTNNYTIEPERLLSIGWGESRPKRPAYPYAAINRRVEIILVTLDN